MKKWNIRKVNQDTVNELLNDENLKTAVFEELVLREPDSQILSGNFQYDALMPLLIPVLVSRGYGFGI